MRFFSSARRSHSVGDLFGSLATVAPCSASGSVTELSVTDISWGQRGDLKTRRFLRAEVYLIRISLYETFARIKSHARTFHV
jgi:hypothetical protein